MMTNETIHDRIQTLVGLYGDGKNTVFANKLGVNEGNIRGYTKSVLPKYDFLEKVVRTFDISPIWLLTGEGAMMKEEQANSDFTREIAIPAKYGEGIPLIPIDAMAGAFTSEQTVMDYDCERYFVPALKGADFLITVKGDSMQPSYNSGDIVACKRVYMSDLFFQWNKVYVLDTNQGALIKRVKPCQDKGCITLVSDNKEYDPIELPKSALNGVALVVGTIRLE